MNTRERFHAIVNFQPFDRLPIIEWASWWDKTIERWRGEGLPEGNRYDLYRHFGMDVWYQDWNCPWCPAPKHHGGGIIESDAEYDELRKTIYPKKDFLNKAMWESWAADQQAGNAVTWFTLQGYFWFPRIIFGIEPHMYAFYDHPQLMNRINEDLLEFNLRVVDEICKITTPDFMTFAEDMSYNHGPMLSKELFDEFLAPFYRRTIPELHKRGIKVIIDSDGDITMPAGWYGDVGADGMLPLERQAGVDMNAMREQSPDMVFIGHYDKMVMPHGEEAMRAEFERILPVASKSGFFPSVDHQTPPGVSLEQYHIYLRLYREYAEKAGKLSANNAVQPRTIAR